MTVIHESARAKVNLTLRVLGRRDDGYHEIESLVAFAGIGDFLTVDSAAPPALLVSGPHSQQIKGKNLVSSALEFLQQTAPDLLLGKAELEKHLPVAAGLGGGSADAAALLRAVQRLNPGYHLALDWPGLARRMGADIPVCLASTSAIMRGLGERITHCKIPPFAALLVNPLAAVPNDKTRRVFHALAAAHIDRAPDEHLAPPSDFEQMLALMRKHGNDLERPALSIMPSIAAVKAALLASTGCRHAQLSGAGPTCFGIYPNLTAASHAERILASREPSWWIRATMIGDDTPVPD